LPELAKGKAVLKASIMLERKFIIILQAFMNSPLEGCYLLGYLLSRLAKSFWVKNLVSSPSGYGGVHANYRTHGHFIHSGLCNGC
jgi:hypothetical protein